MIQLQIPPAPLSGKGDFVPIPFDVLKIDFSGADLIRITILFEETPPLKKGDYKGDYNS